MSLPVVFQYQRALDDFRRHPGSSAPLLKRMSELISLLDLTTTLGSDLSPEEILDAALLIVMGELGASRGALFVRDEAGAYRLRASRGLPPGVPSEAPLGVVAGDAVMHRREGRHRELFEAFDLSLVCPILKAGRAIAALGLGPRADGSSYGDEIQLEFGDERVCAALQAARQTSAAAMVESLVAAASCWSGAAGRSDDLTALILKAL